LGLLALGLDVDLGVVGEDLPLLFLFFFFVGLVLGLAVLAFRSSSRTSSWRRWQVAKSLKV